MGWLRDGIGSAKWAVQDAARGAKRAVKYKAQDVYYKGKEIQDGWESFKEDVSPKQYVDKLNQINKDMESMAKKTQKRVATAQKKLETEYTIANNQRQDVFEKTLPYFESVFSKLKEVEFDSELVKLEKVNKFESIRLSYQDNSIQHNFMWKSSLEYTSPAIVLNPIALGIFVESAIKSTLLETKIEEAKVEYAKLKKECEKAKTSCVKIESLTQAFNRLNGTVKILKKLTENLIKEVDSIEENSGYNYTTYTKEEKVTVMMMYNFTMALNDLVMIEVINKNGKIHPDFEKFIGEAEQIIGSGANE